MYETLHEPINEEIKKGIGLQELKQKYKEYFMAMVFVCDQNNR